MIGRVKKSVPSANLRQGGTLRLLRTFAMSGKATHRVWETFEIECQSGFPGVWRAAVFLRGGTHGDVIEDDRAGWN